VAEEYFKSEGDIEQLPNGAITYELVTQNFPGALLAIKEDARILGHTFQLPCDTHDGELFVQKLISEKELFDRILRTKGGTGIYFVDAYIATDYRHKGLVSEAARLQIQYCSTIKPVTDLYAWAWNVEGERCASKLAKAANLPLHLRK
jgi:hypothetical protein